MINIWTLDHFLLSRYSLSLILGFLFSFRVLRHLQTSHILSCTVLYCMFGGGGQGSGTLWTAEGATHQLEKVKLTHRLPQGTKLHTYLGIFWNLVVVNAVIKSINMAAAWWLVSKYAVLTLMTGPSTCKPLPDFPTTTIKVFILSDSLVVLRAAWNRKGQATSDGKEETGH